MESKWRNGGEDTLKKDFLDPGKFPKTQKRYYQVLYAYRPRNVDELELQENDTVFVIEKCDDGWFIGTSLRTGQFGTFPGNYVERH
uniref:SH3 domain-containing protein n=1 Tax=Setaria digitata TaxID=48799 RepID=A0A915PNW5_9BILA